MKNCKIFYLAVDYDTVNIINFILVNCFQPVHFVLEYLLGRIF